jgi:tRNA dimethylallyltransferase
MKRVKCVVNESKKAVILLMGPTASGKTALAVELVQSMNCEIISVDSALVFKGMDVGTAKPDENMQSIAPHHLIDLIDPSEAYSAADFCEDAHRLIEDIHARGKIPLLVGGTMMYYRVFLQGMANLPIADKVIRDTLEQRWDEEGAQNLHNELRDIDPEAAERIEMNNRQRVLRALETFLNSGKTQTQLWAEQEKNELPFPVLQIGMVPSDRKWLHKRIEMRFKQMMEQGFEHEVKAMFERGDLDENMPSVRCVGYRQMWQYFKGDMTLDESIERGIIATRQLSKRQLTWLRGWEDLVVFDPQQSNIEQRAVSHIEQWLNDLS